LRQEQLRENSCNSWPFPFSWFRVFRVLFRGLLDLRHRHEPHGVGTGLAIDVRNLNVAGYAPGWSLAAIVMVALEGLPNIYEALALSVATTVSSFSASAILGCELARTVEI